MKILIAGASGFIGSALVNYLRQAGHKVFCLRRRKDSDFEGYFYNPEKKLFEGDLEAIDAVINLAGENVASRWSADKKNRIKESRIKTTKLLIEKVMEVKTPPCIFINASAIGFYGHRGEEVLDETSGPGKGFLAEAVQEWEAVLKPLEEKPIRIVCLRFGVVLSQKEGALKKMLMPFKMGLGGIVGSGKQFVSWISLEDVLAAILHILHHTELSGPVNIVAPFPVSNENLTKTLGKVLKRPTFFSLPAFVAKLALGEMAEELLLSSTRAIPKRLLDSGFTFHHPKLEEALSYELSLSSKEK